jgi:hypothetical protein
LNFVSGKQQGLHCDIYDAYYLVILMFRKWDSAVPQANRQVLDRIRVTGLTAAMAEISAISWQQE